MRIGLVVDATCDMPSSVLEKYGIVILPIGIKIGDTVFADTRDEQSALAFAESDIAERGVDVGLERDRLAAAAPLVSGNDEARTTVANASRQRLG